MRKKIEIGIYKHDSQLKTFIERVASTPLWFFKIENHDIKRKGLRSDSPARRDIGISEHADWAHIKSLQIA